MRCKLKTKCPNQTQPLYNCWNPDCEGWIHEGCCKLLLDRHSVPSEERPTIEDRESVDSEPVVFFLKGCYVKWKAEQKKKQKLAAAAAAAVEKELNQKKRKVPWEQDGFMEVLMDWITTHGNYAAYCGPNGHQNKGRSKSAFHKEISLLIKQKKPDSDRDAKDMENKIGTLERQFCEASDWAANTG